MTRINLCSPYELSDQWLIAEYRELPRVFTMVLGAQAKGYTPQTYKIPTEFKLGGGHMKFFADKLGWLNMRYHAIVAEMHKRGFKVSNPRIRIDQLAALDWHWLGDYTPTTEAIRESNTRLVERLIQRPNFYKHYGKTFSQIVLA